MKLTREEKLEQIGLSKSKIQLIEDNTQFGDGIIASVLYEAMKLGFITINNVQQ